MGRRLGGGAQHVDTLKVEPGHGHREAARGVLGEAQLVRRLVGPRVQRVAHDVAVTQRAEGLRTGRRARDGVRRRVQCGATAGAVRGHGGCRVGAVQAAGHGAHPGQGPDVLAVIADAAAVDVEAEQHLGGRVVQAEHDLHGRVALAEVAVPSAQVDDEARAVDVPHLAVACERAEDAPRKLARKLLPLGGAAGAREHEDVHVRVGGMRPPLQQRAWLGLGLGLGVG